MIPTFTGRPTRDNVRAYLHGIGMTLRHDAGEWRVNFRGGEEATAAYCLDLADAAGTGRAMATHRVAASSVGPRRCTTDATRSARTS